jgi:peptidoglycan/xylan/chitin deacetylase (PgdA/CDA1 family)
MKDLILTKTPLISTLFALLVACTPMLEPTTQGGNGSTPGDANSAGNCNTTTINISGPAVSFILDDGDRRDHDLFLPLFKRLGVQAASALNSKPITAGAGNTVTPTMIKAMVAAGWEIQNHSYSHADLTSTSDLSNEIVKSKKELQNLGINVSNVFTYPFGRWNPAVVAELCKSHKFGVAVNGAINTGKVSPWNLSRFGLEPGSNRGFTDQLVRDTKQRNGWLIWLIHSYSWDQNSKLDEVEYAIRTAQSAGLKVVLPSDFLNR